MDFELREDVDGIRLSWNCIPKSTLQHQRNVIPLGALYTPLNNKTEVATAGKESMASCRQCRSFINPFVTMSHDIWACQFCGFTNRINAPIGSPPGVEADCTTIEYSTGRTNRFPPMFIYVVDTCFEGSDVDEAFEALKESLTISLSLLPQNALVSFISYGKHVQVHNLSAEGAMSHVTYNGEKTYVLDYVRNTMSLNSLDFKFNRESSDIDPVGSVLGTVGVKYMQPVGIVEYQLNKIISSLIPNSFPRNAKTERPLRATGAALNIASLFLTSLLGNSDTSGGHLLCFVAGACTHGPGKVVSLLLKEPLRSHRDIIASTQVQLPKVNLHSTTPADLNLLKQGKKIYSDIAKRFVALNISCDLFIGSYDQIGLFEMEELCHKTGGIVVLSDSFETSIFKQSFMKFLRKREEGSDLLDMAFNCTLECHVSSDLKIQGLLGHASAIALAENNPDKKYVSATRIGEGNAFAWALCSTDSQSTYALYFEKLDSGTSDISFIQFMFHYVHPSGDKRLRVTTVPISVVGDRDLSGLEYGFDQETALVLLAKEAVNKLQVDSSLLFTSKFTPMDVVRQLDKSLIDFCSKVAIYSPGNFQSFGLASTYSLIPQFIFQLRRSNLINVFNSSPDETYFIRHIFMHEDLANSLTIIQPTLLSYDIETFGELDENGEPNLDPEPVLLDSMSLGHGKILLLDSFFHILIFHGSRVAAWRKAKYHEMEEYSHFKEFLEAPKREAVELLIERFPLPRFIDCDENGSQARFLMARLNPSSSYAVNPFQQYGDQLDVFTDDISLQMYMDNVKHSVIGKKRPL